MAGMHSASPWWLPPNAAAHGSAVDQLLRWNIGALALCFVVAHVLLAITLLQKPKSQPAASSGSARLQLLSIVLFSTMYLVMAISAQRLWALNRFEGAAPASMQVEVTGRQFQWYFRYPGADAIFGEIDPSLIQPANGNPLGLVATDEHGRDDIVSSELVLPVNREVDITLRAQDVIHGLYIPAMRLQQNAVPGQILHVHFTPMALGIYPILCAQVCGLGHARMQARLRVVSSDDYQRWLRAKSAAVSE
jgi:cytochrome c oxidase subunit 2